jgi:hypothetical protein
MTDSNAIRHGLDRLGKSRDFLKRIECAQTLDDAASAWSDLLINGNAVYSKLEQGSKVNGRALGWYGRAKKARKDDPLLSYMHHARNSEEHSIEDVTTRMKAGQATVTIREPFDPKKLEGLELRIDTDKHGHVLVSSSNEDIVSTRMYDKPSLVLVRVKDDRYSDYFDPPYEHLGKALPDQLPSTVGGLFIAYLAALIDEAKSFGI